MEGRRGRGRGRRRITIQRIEQQRDRYATFSKRRLGLVKKASEIATLCDVDIGVVIFSPSNKSYSFFHPTMEWVIGRVTSPNGEQGEGARIVETFTRNRVSQFNQIIENLNEEMEDEKDRENTILDGGADGGLPWDGGAIENYSTEEVESLTGLLENIRLELNG